MVWGKKAEDCKWRYCDRGSWEKQAGNAEHRRNWECLRARSKSAELGREKSKYVKESWQGHWTQKRDEVNEKKYKCVYNQMEVNCVVCGCKENKNNWLGFWWGKGARRCTTRLYYSLYELQFQQSHSGLRLDWQLLVHQRQVVPDSLHAFFVTWSYPARHFVHHLYKQRGSFLVTHNFSWWLIAILSPKVYSAFGGHCSSLCCVMTMPCPVLSYCGRPARPSICILKQEKKDFVPKEICICEKSRMKSCWSLRSCIWTRVHLAP